MIRQAAQAQAAGSEGKDPSTAQVLRGSRSNRISQTRFDLLLRNDPLNVNYGGGVDAYRPEIERIAQRLPTCRGAEQICSAIHEELCKSFGQAAVGRRGRYLAMAKELRALRTERPG